MPVGPELNFATLAGEGLEAVFDLGDGTPRLVHLGAPVDGDPSDLAAALEWPTPEAGIDALVPLTVLSRLQRAGHVLRQRAAARRIDRRMLQQ